MSLNTSQPRSAPVCVCVCVCYGSGEGEGEIEQVNTSVCNQC